MKRNLNPRPKLRARKQVSVRMWLDTTVKTTRPANVFSKFDELRSPPPPPPFLAACSPSPGKHAVGQAGRS